MLKINRLWILFPRLFPPLLPLRRRGCVEPDLEQGHVGPTLPPERLAGERDEGAEELLEALERLAGAAVIRGALERIVPLAVGGEGHEDAQRVLAPEFFPSGERVQGLLAGCV